MKLSRDIQSLSDFKQNASKMVKQVQETKQPIVLTVNGKAAAVIQDPDTYEEMAADSEFNATLRAIDRAMEDWDNRKNWPEASEVFAEIRKSRGIK